MIILIIRIMRKYIGVFRLAGYFSRNEESTGSNPVSYTNRSVRLTGEDARFSFLRSRPRRDRLQGSLVKANPPQADRSVAMGSPDSYRDVRTADCSICIDGGVPVFHPAGGGTNHSCCTDCRMVQWQHFRIWLWRCWFESNSDNKMLALAYR